MIDLTEFNPKLTKEQNIENIEQRINMRAYWKIKQREHRTRIRDSTPKDYPLAKLCKNTKALAIPSFCVFKPKQLGVSKHNNIKQGRLLEGFQRRGRDRERLLYAYRNTCYDCKNLTPPKELDMHLDFDSLPVKAIMLCKTCHRKRHGFKTRKVVM